MKVISTIISPIPDEEGYHVFECDECEMPFLIHPHDIDDKESFYCPYCGNGGGIVSFTEKIRRRLFLEHEKELLAHTSEPIQNDSYQLDNIQELVEELTDKPNDIHLLEYQIEEVIDESNLIQYEFICCEKIIKVSMEAYNNINFCSFCKGEILLNITE